MQDHRIAVSLRFIVVRLHMCVHARGGMHVRMCMSMPVVKYSQVLVTDYAMHLAGSDWI